MPYRPVRPSSKRRVPGVIYMIHFPAPYQHAKHYTGWTEGPDIGPRLQAHATGRGSPLVYAMCQANGITSGEQLRQHVAATWPGDRYLERRIKNRGGASKSCPTCKGGESCGRNKLADNLEAA